MKALKDKILSEGTAIGSEIVKVDCFLNHCIDVAFMEKIGEEFHRRFSDCHIDRILTVEASGIAVACMTARYFGYPPVVFAKKAKPSTMTEDAYTAKAVSFTKGTVSEFRVSQQFLYKGERVLIIDDFLARGGAAVALTDIAEQAGSEVVGIGTVIEKGFQGGSDKLRARGYRVESLAVIDRNEDGVITFR